MKITNFIFLIYSTGIASGITFNLEINFGFDSSIPVGVTGYLVAPTEGVSDPNPTVTSLNTLSGFCPTDTSNASFTAALSNSGYSVLQTLTSVDGGGGIGAFVTLSLAYNTSTLPGLEGLDGGEELGIIWSSGNNIFGFIGSNMEDPLIPTSTTGWLIPNDGESERLVDLSTSAGGRVDFSSINQIGEIKPVPEPTSSALLALGGLALIARRRR